MENPTLMGIKWRHYIKGGVYEVIATGYIKATMEPAVVYKSSEDIVFIRTLEEFMEKFVCIDWGE